MDRTTPRRLAGFLLGLAALAGPAADTAGASLITFEQRPNGETPTDDTRLVNPYQIEGGGTVRFFFDTNDNLAFDNGVDILPWFEQVGANGDDGFLSSHYSGQGTRVYDRAREGYGAQLGRFFIRQLADGEPETVGPRPDPFVILYDTTQTIREFSGEIWDIDGAVGGTEQWMVEALDAAGNRLAGVDEIYSPIGVDGGPGSLDSLPWTFGFRDLPDGLRAIRLTFIGTKEQGVGLAFNNFSATRSLAPVPEPSSLALAAFGGLGLLAAARRLRGRA
jgi:hypothetical protein